MSDMPLSQGRASLVKSKGESISASRTGASVSDFCDIEFLCLKCLCLKVKSKGKPFTSSLKGKSGQV